MNFAAMHARSLAMLIRMNAPLVAFTKKGASSEDANGVVTHAPDVVVQMRMVSDPTSGDLVEFQKLSLVNRTAKRCFAVPVTYGQRAPVDAMCTWGGQAYRVHSTAAGAEPDGMNIGEYVHLVSP